MKKHQAPHKKTVGPTRCTDLWQRQRQRQGQGLQSKRNKIREGEEAHTCQQGRWGLSAVLSLITGFEGGGAVRYEHVQKCNGGGGIDVTALALENGPLHHWRSLLLGEARVAWQAAMVIVPDLCCGTSCCVVV